MTNNCTGYLIDPHAKTITPVVLPLVVGNVPIREMYKLMDCDCVDIVHVPGTTSPRTSFDLWVDDEGLYRDGQAFFYVTHVDGPAYGHRTLAGKALVLGSDDEGNSIGATVDMRTLAKRIVWAHPTEGKREADELLARSGTVIEFNSMEELLDFMRQQGGL